MTHSSLWALGLYLDWCITHGSPWLCCVFGQIYDARLTTSLLYIWTTIYIKSLRIGLLLLSLLNCLAFFVTYLFIHSICTHVWHMAHCELGVYIWMAPGPFGPWPFLVFRHLFKLLGSYKSFLTPFVTLWPLLVVFTIWRKDWLDVPALFLLLGPKTYSSGRRAFQQQSGEEKMEKISKGSTKC